MADSETAEDTTKSGTESEPEPSVKGDKSTTKKKKKKKQHQKQHKHKKKYSYEHPGVARVILSDEVQELLNCVVGEVLTSEKPWGRIHKYLVQEQIESEDIPEIFMPFYPYKFDLQMVTDDDLLIGYIPDESREYDEFYLCLTPEAEEHVAEVTQRIERAQQRRLKNTINKKVGEWTSLGSAEEIDENNAQSSRGLYKVEYETKYPILYGEVCLEMRRVEDARDGYAELLVPARNAMNIIWKQRIDAGTQVAPSVKISEAQTNYVYPTNAWTQYEYEYQCIEKVTVEFMAAFNQYFSEELDGICDQLGVNSQINLYTNEYENLVQSEEYRAEVQKLDLPEYTSFKDVQRCKDKMISAVAWHPMWTGTVALAYANVSPRWCHRYQQTGTEYLNEVVYGNNPVLIWCFNDNLFPKLLLQTPREVHALMFCPHDENLLIGGLENGQVVLWDIKNKINKVEEEEILTTAQQHYRVQMFSYMHWMKNTRDFSLVLPTVISELSYSHPSNVTSLSWICPYHKVTLSGQYIYAPEDETSLQFISSSSDGTIKFWDLKQKPIVVPGDYKPERKSRRLKKRPSALTVDVSSYRNLNRKLRPHFQINVELPNETYKCPLSTAQLTPFELIYEETDPDPNRIVNISDRIIHKPNLEKRTRPPINEFYVGTYLGDFAVGCWEGFDYLSGDVVCQEQARITTIGRYHDGPVLTIQRNTFLDDLYLSVGGKVFAIWKTLLNDKPIFWRRSRHKYTDGYWSLHKPDVFRLLRSDGDAELWILQQRSDTFCNEMCISGKALLNVSIHPFKTDYHLSGVADDRGSLRLLFMPLTKSVESKEFMEKMTTVTAETIKKYAIWQEAWTEKHATWIKEQQEEAVAEQIRKREELELQKQREEEMKEQMELEAARAAAAKLRAPPGKYEEWAQEQWINKEQERMENVLLSKKRLDKETLIAQQAPLKKIEMEEERKRQKQRERLHKSGKIFREMVSTLFPDLLETKEGATEVSDIWSPDEVDSVKKGFYHDYLRMEEESKDYIDENAYEYNFDWNDVLVNGKNARKNKDFQFGQNNHRNRYEEYKKNRKPMPDGYEYDTQKLYGQEHYEAKVASESDIMELFQAIG